MSGYFRSAETFALATELVSLRGGSAEQVLAAAVRLYRERERAVQAERERLDAALTRFRRNMRPPYPSSNHDWMYDEDGLPVW